MNTCKAELSMEQMNTVAAGYREGLTLYKSDKRDEQIAYIRKNAGWNAESNTPLHDSLQFWLDFNVKAENSDLSMVDVAIAVKEGYGIKD